MFQGKENWSKNKRNQNMFKIKINHCHYLQLSNDQLSKGQWPNDKE